MSGSRDDVYISNTTRTTSITICITSISTINNNTDPFEVNVDDDIQ